MTGHEQYSGEVWLGHFWRTRIGHQQSVPLSWPFPNSRDWGVADKKNPWPKTAAIKNNNCLIQDLILDENDNLACITEILLEAAGGLSLSQLHPSGYKVLQQPRLQGKNVLPLSFRMTSPSLGYPAPQCAGSKCLHIMLQGQDRLGILRVYLSHNYPSVSLPELTKMVSAVDY